MAKKKTAKKRATKKSAAATKPDRTERSLAAKLKAHRGEKLTQTESRDVTWYDKSQREAALEDVLPAIPKGLYCQMSGRQQKVIDEQAERYDLPIGGETVDLFDAIASLHDLIAENARSIMPARESSDVDDEGDVYELKVAKLKEEVRKLKTGNDRLAIALSQDRGDTIDRRDLRDILGWLSTRLQGFGQQLRRSSGGEEAQKSCNEFLEHLAQEVEHGVLRV